MILVPFESGESGLSNGARIMENGYLYPRLGRIGIGTIFDPNSNCVETYQTSNSFRAYRIVPFIVPSKRDHRTMETPMVPTHRTMEKTKIKTMSYR